MSAIRFALRVSAEEALKGRTLAGEHVRDSAIAAIDLAADGKLDVDPEARAPFIAIYTDGSTSEDTDTRNLRQNGALEMIFESGVTAQMVEIDPDTATDVIVDMDIPATDPGLEAALDVLDTQIQRALTDPDNEWAEVWRKLSDGSLKLERSRIARADDGVRRAARQMRVTVGAKPDPVYGEPLADTHALMRFRRLVQRDRPELLSTLDMMLGTRGEVTVDTIRQAFGHTAAEASALGYAVREGDNDEPAPTG